MYLLVCIIIRVSIIICFYVLLLVLGFCVFIALFLVCFYILVLFCCFIICLCLCVFVLCYCFVFLNLFEHITNNASPFTFTPFCLT
jgi:hypothetical protein